MTKTMEKDKAVIILAGRQRMLIEKYAKEHLQGLLPLQASHSILKTAEVATLQIKEDRQYAEDVIGKLKIEVPEVHPNSGYTGSYDGIHLPDTFEQGVSNAIDKKRLYSYALLSRWNINKENGLNTDFENEAFDYFLRNEGKVFYRFMEYNGNYTLRYATPDIATADACVSCHNSHEESNRHDFGLGDLMGMLVINIPVGPVNVGIDSIFGDLEKDEHSRNKFIKTKKVFDVTLEALINGGEAPLDLGMIRYMVLSPETDSTIINKLKEVKSYWNNIQENIEKLSHVELNSVEYIVAYDATDSSVNGGLVVLNEAVFLYQDRSEKKAILLLWCTLGGFLGVTFLTVGFCWKFLISRHIVKPIQKLTSGTRLIAEGRLDQEIEVKSGDEIGILTQNFNDMLCNLREYRTRIEMNNWLQTGKAELNDRMPGARDISILSENIISYLSEYLRAQIGAIYITDEENLLILVGSYACSDRNIRSKKIRFGEGLVGQSALEKKYILLNNSSGDYFIISSVPGETTPNNIILFPFQMDGFVKGVIELGSLHEFTANDITFLEQVSESIAISIHSHTSREKMATLLAHTQKQAATLQSQQEELSCTNEELEEQAANLKLSEEKLQRQQEELKVSNEELVANSIILREQKNALDQKNIDFEKTRKEIEQKAKDLELANKFKSEFLANMSHELRTPLNCLLILAKLLHENKDRNLTDMQVEFAKIIYQSGNDLLALIDDILDLSKIEAGKLEINWEEIHLSSYISQLEKTFMPVAKEKKLGFSVTISDDVPENLNSDSARLAQIIKNFLSNSFKFTTQGEVCLAIEKPGKEVEFFDKSLSACKTIAIKVTDTGIGLSMEKQRIVFEAFRQADSRTSRKYGGTGLGLSISREMANLLGGEIHLESEEGKGSTFILFLPVFPSGRGVLALEGEEMVGVGTTIISENDSGSSDMFNKGQKKVEGILDDRRNLKAGDKSLLLIDDDPVYLRILSELAREKGFKTLVAGDGHTGLHMADYYRPSAIILDIRMLKMDGCDVMKRLKENNNTCYIPVHVISVEKISSDTFEMGAIGYLRKPVEIEGIEKCFAKIESLIHSTVKSILIVEDDIAQKKLLTALLMDMDISVTVIDTGEEAVELLKKNQFDCVIVDLSLAGNITGFELTDIINNDDTIPRPPIIVYTGRDLSVEEENRLKQCSDSIIIKGNSSPERLRDEVTLFLHKVEEELPVQPKKAMESAYSEENGLDGKTVLIVDDDIRNVFALTSVLQDCGMSVVIGKNGREGIDQLQGNYGIDIVLMDIMMPEMDGYEAMREIRRNNEYKSLPIIALTAKAMKGEKDRCTEAGANDYMSKPVDTDRLLSLMRVWIHQH